MKKYLFIILFFVTLLVLAQTPTDSAQQQFTLENCVTKFDPNNVNPTKVGYQFWFVDKEFLDGRTLKMSMARPHSATHAPHSHSEDEFFFVLEGTAEFCLDGQTTTASAYASFYCPPNSMHGIRNVGDTELKYLVIKKYPKKD
ncbi:MAG: cupin domain-containing protein [Sedimentisphaerales bacterium]|nr:cupin domain-containing protein [Sedimentisphaerales bacterium]